MSGEKNLAELLANMKPILNSGKYVFTSVKDTSNIPRSSVICEMKEKEGTTIVIAQEKADILGLKYEYVAAWITLEIHSSLEAVGLTAAFANALADHQISCNVIAGYYHDHIFVHIDDGAKAIEVLGSM